MQASEVGTINDTALHCFIVRCSNGRVEYWDMNGTREKINEVTTNEDYGKLVIGSPVQTSDIAQTGKGKIYEIILFDEAIDDDKLTPIKDFVKRFYDFVNPTNSVKPSSLQVVNKSLLKNLA